MNIVTAAACTSGTAHAYIAKGKLIQATEDTGHTIHVETQETISTEDKSIAEQIKAADVAILTIDIAIAGTEHSEGKKTIKVPTNVCAKVPKQLIRKTEAELSK